MNNRERQPISDRIQSKIVKINGCHVWSGHRHIDGYGLIRISKKSRLVHRVAYSMYIGPTMGMQVLHRCDNPPCCNPDHLFLGTHLDNKKDMISKNRHAKGEKIGKLRQVDVINLRLLGQDQIRVLSYKELGQMFNICEGQVTKIINRTQWKHI